MSVSIASVEVNPASGNQAEEFLIVTNGTSFPVDLTGWKISGGIEFTFKPGTVIGSNSALYVVASVPAFRARASGPRGGQSLFVAGAYSGQLSARGESLQLVNQFGQAVNAFATPAAPSLAQQFLRVTELMYHPDFVAGNTNDAEAFEFIELKNISTNTTLNLAGVRLINGVEFDFTGSAVTALTPGETTVIVRNLAAFVSRYGAGRNVAGQFTGALENGGERLQLVDANNEEILDFSYDNNWHPITDGLGFSLIVVNENAEPDAWSSAYQWRPSGAVGGSPSTGEPAAPVIPRVVVNSVIARSDVPPPTDSIELLNLFHQTANLSGWYLSDDFNTPKKFRIPNGITLAAGASIAFDESQFNPGGNGFALGSDGDEVWLFSADLAGNLTGYVHGFEFGASEDRVPFSRWVTSTGREDFVASNPQSSGGGPKVGPIVITEIQYHPSDLADGSDNSAEEFIELHNATDTAQPLFDSLLPANTWRLRGGVSFSFPANITLAPRETVLLVNFAPTNTALTDAFRSTYSVPASTRLFGPYGGKLGNDGDDVRLEKPTTPVGGNVPFVLVDRVRYSDAAPWPAGADGDGLSLQRRSGSIYGDDPNAWSARPTTAGNFQNDATPAPTIVLQPASQNAIAFQDVALQISASGNAPLRYQWRFNGDTIGNATNATLLLPAIQPNQAGAYDVLVFNDHGSVLSATANITLKYPAFIQSQPASVQVRVRPDPAALAITNTSFTVTAYSPSPLTYQWLHNGAEIPGATNGTLAITNVQLANGGDYSVRITDEVGVVQSAPAALIPLITPTIVQGVTPQFVAPGASVTLSVVASGSPFPFGYEWRRGSASVRSNIVSSPTNFYTFTASTNPFTTNQYRVIVRNLASIAVSANSLAAIITLPDFDQDGIIDLYEQAVGMNTNNAADALEDLDGDGMRNRDEFQAGTDPTNAASYLRVDLSTGATQASVQFAAISNRTYSVEFTDGFNGGPWFKLTDVVASTNNRVQTIPDPTWTTNRFYRVVNPAQP
ncbi:MAG: lamin tail domain-containing protein [Verrucomicrobia bacterium]|nr:lamin tail domain-containing protein [Verrucomicrobiota bacterium]